MTDTVPTDTAAAAPFTELNDGLRDTFESGLTRSLDWRAGQLDALIALLEENEAELVRAIQNDLGRPDIEAYTADVGTTKVEIRHIRKHFRSWARTKRVRLPLTALPGRGRILPEPVGVALVVSPWNYPIQLLLEPLAAAVAAGNCVVAKPSELSPATSAVLARLVPKYLDDQAITLVEGGVPETSALLEQRFDHIFFTGSTRVGQVVMEAATRHLTPVTLELGGKSPAIVADDADLETAARRIAWGKHLNAGQTCIAPDYVLADASVRDRLVDLLVRTQNEFVGGDPATSPDFARIVNRRHLDRLAGLLDGHGGTLVSGGEVDADQRYLAPTVITDPDLDSPLMHEEIFGPILPVLSFDGIDEAIGFVNTRPKPLALYVFSGSHHTVGEVLERTSSGGACVNATLLHVLPPSLPFGGVGPSGMGSYHGEAGFRTFSHYKSVLDKPTRPDPPVLYPPYTRWKERLVKRFF